MLPAAHHLFSIPLALTISILLTLSGCSSSTEPSPGNPDVVNRFEGSIDTGTSSFILRSIEGPASDGSQILIDLIARNLITDFQNQRVLLEVAIKNSSRRPFYAPAKVKISDFEPADVQILNADGTDCPDTTTGPSTQNSCEFIFDYSNQFGEDGLLAPNEVSGFRQWVFAVPELVAFSFGVTAQGADEPEESHIAGLFFFDDNENGSHDAGELPVTIGHVMVTGPGIDEPNQMVVGIGEDGRYAFPITQPGLYTLTGFPPPTGSALPTRFTTPNPLEVVITTDVDGNPVSFTNADFGLARFGGWDNLIVTISSPDSIISHDGFVSLRVEARNEGANYLIWGHGSSSCQLGAIVEYNGLQYSVSEFRVCTEDLAEQGLAPGESRVETWLWDGQILSPNGPSRLPAGRYRLFGNAGSWLSRDCVVIEVIVP